MKTSLSAPVRPESSNWLISFGDLLTLLVCFFMTGVTFGPLNPANSPINTDNYQKNTDNPSELNSGTTLALMPTKDGQASSVQALFTAGDFDPITGQLSDQARQRFEAVLNQAGTRVEIESCSAHTLNASIALARGYEQSLRRAADGVATRSIAQSSCSSLLQYGPAIIARVVRYG